MTKAINDLFALLTTIWYAYMYGVCLADKGETD
jgi:hypothetical protein